MSDAKPRRGGRDMTGSDVSSGESVQPEAVRERPDAAAPAPVAAPAPAPPLPAASVQASLSAARATEESVRPAGGMPENAWVALAEVQAALARGCEEIALEMNAITRSGIAAATDAATAMLDAHTFAEAIEISAGLIRRRTDAMIEGSARLSEIGVQAATAASRPILAGWLGTAGRS